MRTITDARDSLKISSIMLILALVICKCCGVAAASEAPANTGGTTTDRPRAVRGDDGRIQIETDRLKAEIWPEGYVSGIKAGTFMDRKTGARDNSFGLDIVDFLMGPGAEGGLPYKFGNKVHGDIAKHYIELPQICTKARSVDTEITRGGDFVAVRQWWKWTEAAPRYRPGSAWEQIIVFPKGRRYFFSSDRVQSINTVENLFLRTDLPCHVRHKKGDTFEQVYLSYQGRIGAEAFLEDFAPDERYLYRRSAGDIPTRMIRAHKIRGAGMPWLVGMTLDPRVVSEAWCHQRGYVCFIQEIGGLPVKAGDNFAATYIIGYFDSVDQMQNEYDRYRGFTSLAATDNYWCLSEGVIVQEGADRFRVFPQGQWPAQQQWRVFVHGHGRLTINGRRITVDGEQTVKVPRSERHQESK